MTDHKAEAERLLEFEQAVSQEPAKAALASAAAQVHATLYLAEQQRIANIIAITPRFPGDSAGEYGSRLDRLRVGLAGDVWDGLALS